MSFSDSDFRHVLGRFATGVTVITTADKNKLYGVTINSFASVSLNPPLVLFSLDKNATTYQHFINSDNFVVNILAENQVDISKLFAHPPVVDWDSLDYTIGADGCPIISGNIAYLECTKETVYDGGDHSIFIGKVNSLEKNSNDKPLVYFGGNYSRVASD
jgi:flavin reductase (DIM6/NTAB) family NADH-FMN oxidoreductase RutF